VRKNEKEKRCSGLWDSRYLTAAGEPRFISSHDRLTKKGTERMYEEEVEDIM